MNECVLEIGFICGLTFHLFLDYFGGIEPMGNAVRIGVLQSEVILFNQVQMVIDLLHQLLARGFFLQRETRASFQVPIILEFERTENLPRRRRTCWSRRAE